MIPAELFFAIMVALQALDAFSTAKALRNGGVELNGFLKKLMKAIGVNDALFLMKAGYLVFLWNYPVESAWVQWASIAVFVAVAVNNYRVLKKMGVL